jgi:hypothetical protein
MAGVLWRAPPLVLADGAARATSRMVERLGTRISNSNSNSRLCETQNVGEVPSSTTLSRAAALTNVATRCVGGDADRASPFWQVGCHLPVSSSPAGPICTGGEICPEPTLAYFSPTVYICAMPNCVVFANQSDS